MHVFCFEKVQGSLVQRELSAKLTEGLLHCSIDICTNALEILIDFVICNTNYTNTIRFEKSCSLRIFFRVLFFKMLRSIQFNDNLSLCTVKIRNIITNHFLPYKPNRIRFQKVIPQMPFFLCHVPAQLFCQWNKLFIVFILHATIPPPH